MKTWQLLYVEDNEDDVFLLKHAFQSAEAAVQISHVPDSQAAIKYLIGDGEYEDRSRFPMPDLVLLDINMPGMDGLDLLAWIRSQPVLMALRVLIYSSSSKEQDIARAHRLGANAYVVKPTSLPERLLLARAIKKYCSEPNWSGSDLPLFSPEQGAWAREVLA